MTCYLYATNGMTGSREIIATGPVESFAFRPQGRGALDGILHCGRLLLVRSSAGWEKPGTWPYGAYYHDPLLMPS